MEFTNKVGKSRRSYILDYKVTESVVINNHFEWIKNGFGKKKQMVDDIMFCLKRRSIVRRNKHKQRQTLIFIRISHVSNGTNGF